MQKLDLEFIKPELIEPNIWIIALKIMKNNIIMENKYKGRREVVDHIGLVRFRAHGNVGSTD